MTEALWAGEFGDAYTARNLNATGRSYFWQQLVDRYGITEALEIGCNAGANLIPLSELTNVVGVDVNQGALDRLPSWIPTRCCSALDLPFEDASFDLTFTVGLLIHIQPEDLERVMREILRCSGRYVLCGEYFSEIEEAVPYRDQESALWRRDYGALYEALGLTLRDTGFLSEGSWDNITWWLFERA